MVQEIHPRGVIWFLDLMIQILQVPSECGPSNLVVLEQGHAQFWSQLNQKKQPKSDTIRGCACQLAAAKMRVMQIVKRSEFVQKLLKRWNQFAGFLFVSVSNAKETKTMVRKFISKRQAIFL